MTLASQGNINLDFLRKKGDQPITVKALSKSNWEVIHGISHHWLLSQWQRIPFPMAFLTSATDIVARFLFPPAFPTLATCSGDVSITISAHVVDVEQRHYEISAKPLCFCWGGTTTPKVLSAPPHCFGSVITSPRGNRIPCHWESSQRGEMPWVTSKFDLELNHSSVLTPKPSKNPHSISLLIQKRIRKKL